MERDFVRWLAGRLPSHPRLLVGLGDDAAILRMSPGDELVATTDMLMDGVDFLTREHDARRIGRKALAVNLSDLAAMGARPLAALVSLALPRDGGEALARELYEGLLPLAAEFDCPIAGGDTNSWDGPLTLNVTALGQIPARRRWRRSGAAPGDAILVTGTLGGSLLEKQFTFVPRVAEALWLAEHCEIHAAMDISDGLLIDLARMCEASACGAVLDFDAVPVSRDAGRLAERDRDGRSALDHALADGEDFELLLAVSADVAEQLIAEQPLDVAVTKIGVIQGEAGLFAREAGGTLRPLEARGYEHRLT